MWPDRRPPPNNLQESTGRRGGCRLSALIPTPDPRTAAATSLSGRGYGHHVHHVITTRTSYAVFTGVRLGGGVRVAAERSGESRALHPVRGADGPPERGHQQDRVAETVGD